MPTPSKVNHSQSHADPTWSRESLPYFSFLTRLFLHSINEFKNSTIYEELSSNGLSQTFVHLSPYSLFSRLIFPLSFLTLLCLHLKQCIQRRKRRDASSQRIMIEQSRRYFCVRPGTSLSPSELQSSTLLHTSLSISTNSLSTVLLGAAFRKLH